MRYTGKGQNTGKVILDIGGPTGFEPVDIPLEELVSEEWREGTEIDGERVILNL